MDKGTVKKIILLLVFFAMMGGLGLWVTKWGPEGSSVKPSVAPPATLDTAKLTTQWPQIVTQAAAPARGEATARYTLAEFGDFQCPQCGKARPFLEALLKKYPSKVNLIFIHRPFPQLHQWAIPAGQASEIAAAHGKFWTMYDILYAHQDDLEPGFYADYAAQIGMNKSEFQKAFDAGQGQDHVKSAQAFSDTLGVQETPTILLHDNLKNTIAIYVGLDGTHLVNGALQYSGIKDLVARPPWNSPTLPPSPQ